MLSPMITLDDLKKSEKMKTLIKKADLHLEAIGYTEHSFRHMGLVSYNTKEILKKLVIS